MSKIIGLAILPPIAIARLGSSEQPVDAYDLEADPVNPLGYRRIVPQLSLHVDPGTGEVTETYIPAEIQFRDKTGIHPVAPFFEVHARMEDGSVYPLTQQMLDENGLKPSNVAWTVEVANLKVFRRTGKDDDKVVAEVITSNHDIQPLEGKAENFLPGKYIPFGHVRYLKPTPGTSESSKIRLRFTPATGKVYGGSQFKHDEKGKEITDPLDRKSVV